MIEINGILLEEKNIVLMKLMMFSILLSYRLIIGFWIMSPKKNVILQFFQSKYYFIHNEINQFYYFIDFDDKRIYHFINYQINRFYHLIDSQVKRFLCIDSFYFHISGVIRSLKLVKILFLSYLLYKMQDKQNFTTKICSLSFNIESQSLN